jgi:hypothetical protein
MLCPPVNRTVPTLAAPPQVIATSDGRDSLEVAPYVVSCYRRPLTLSINREKFQSLVSCPGMDSAQIDMD